INENTDEKNNWIFKGIELIDNDLCPFCNKKISQKNKSFYSKLVVYNKNYLSTLRDNIEEIKTVGIEEVPTTTKGIKDLESLINRVMIALEQYNVLDETIKKLSDCSANLEQISKIKYGADFCDFFPSLIPHIEIFNNNLSSIQKESKKAKKRTSKLLENKIRLINKLINECNIPYYIMAKYDKSTIKEYKLIHRDDKKNLDRKDSLSEGEKNTISILLFLLDCQKSNANLIIIDDPISSMDFYRRSIVMNYILEFLRDKTTIVMSHDSVFSKYAVNSKAKNIGEIVYLENINNKIKTVKIEKKDFKKFDDFIVERIKRSTDYYKKIINLRMLYEGCFNSLEYGYLSCILHKTTELDLIKELKSKKVTEKDILTLIHQKHKIRLEKFSDDLYLNIDPESYSNLEKAVLYREYKKYNNKKIKRNIKDEINFLLHLNDRLVVCLDPYKFTFASKELLNELNTFMDEFCASINN
ncbi:MAG: hypothetical protein RR659_05660, partial [Bacilli bacterium]